MNKLYILCGIPFAGKTTLAKGLEKRLGFLRIDLDDIKFELLGDDVKDEDMEQSQWDKVYLEMYKKIEEGLKQGKNVVSDTGNFTKHERDLLRNIASKIVIDSMVIFVYTPVNIVKQRWQENKETNKRFHISEKSFSGAVKELEIPGNDENVIIYDGSVSVDKWLQNLRDL